MSLKTYETIGVLNRSVLANIDGKGVSIFFKNGTSTPRLIKGRYMTSNRKIQEYLEKSGNFNKKYRLISEVMTRDDKFSESVSVDETNAKEQTITTVIPDGAHDDIALTRELQKFNLAKDDDVASMSVQEDTDEDVLQEPTPAQTIVVYDVINGQQARNYLMQAFKDLTFRQLTNNAQIIAAAKARNVQFTSWETFVTSK